MGQLVRLSRQQTHTRIWHKWNCCCLLVFNWRSWCQYGLFTWMVWQVQANIENYLTRQEFTWTQHFLHGFAACIALMVCQLAHSVTTWGRGSNQFAFLATSGFLPNQSIGLNNVFNHDWLDLFVCMVHAHFYLLCRRLVGLSHSWCNHVPNWNFPRHLFVV